MRDLTGDEVLGFDDESSIGFESDRIHAPFVRSQLERSEQMPASFQNDEACHTNGTMRWTLSSRIDSWEKHHVARCTLADRSRPFLA